MGAAIGDVLGNAVGVAISPVPVIAVILMLFSPAAARNAPAFLAGWVLALGAVTAAVAVLGGLGGGDGSSVVGGVVKVVVGLLFLVLALRQWRSRPVPGAEPQPPAWMSSIDSFTAAKAFGFGAVFAGANPKNLGLTLAAATTIASSGLATGGKVAVGAVYVVLASLTVAVPVVAYLVARDRVAPALDRAKVWLVANNATVMVVLFLVLGAKVLGDGISALLRP
ncbi:GAP family protein [Terrabacter carboxydivorans]|uniref:Sap-like sulfolipid-1-addressing protein n=1 Tax=Terrabacter carboxydivorans TaxID=619730 RepID=A0ABN3LCH5_9MICO